jgi:hypothetical protein
MVKEFENIFWASPCPLAEDYQTALDSNVDFVNTSSEEWFDYNAAYMGMSV